MIERNRIELRSEKVRNIIGEEAPFFVRYGITIVFVVMLFVFLLAYVFYLFDPTVRSIFSHSSVG